MPQPALSTVPNLFLQVFPPAIHRVFTAGVSLNGNAVDIEVTVDKNSIQNIALVNLSEPVTTLYPSLESTFSELCASVIESGSTKNITYPAENKYTATMLLNAIQTALDKCTIQ